MRGTTARKFSGNVCRESVCPSAVQSGTKPSRCAPLQFSDRELLDDRLDVSDSFCRNYMLFLCTWNLIQNPVPLVLEGLDVLDR
jgi:hypothetical protein